MSKPAPPSCRTTNWRAFNAALKQRGSLLIWLDSEMEWLAALSGRRRRPATFSDTAIQARLMLKALFGLPLRQTAGLVASLLKLAKLDWSVPDFSTLCRRQEDLTVTIPYSLTPGAARTFLLTAPASRPWAKGSGARASTYRASARTMIEIWSRSRIWPR
ncbi:hypothetical protein FHG71_22515 [Rubellimicrobium roseum]|uniref:Transposase DDE domain-containing protein n=1 Tax=Rubellimicrobium roseum TaxID=687525 RepID=A0A5C4N5M2_9RHOB|nr:hypothetical protein FHG71_22515 [Rubellimicrobium roseum]